MKKIFIILVVLFTVCRAYGLRPTKEPGAELAEACSGCDKLVVRTGGMCHRSPQVEKVINRVAGAKLVAEVRRLFVFTGAYASVFSLLKEGGGEEDVVINCMCCGEYTLEFYRGQKLVVSISVHHWKHVRSEAVAGGADLTLTDPSIDSLRKYLEALQSNSEKKG